MSQRLNEYFASEAAEYLDQLDRLLALTGPPDQQQVLRLATGVRGSAQMAQAETIAGVAQRLEDAARAIVSRNVSWSEEIRHLARQTVADLQLLLRAVNRWGREEERRVREAIERWDELEGVTQPEAGVVPIEMLFYDDEGPHVLSRGGDDGAVPIQELLLRGDRALRRALELRPEVERLVAGEPPSSAAAAEIVAELFDLIQLGMSDRGPEE
jgi:chemotaxis protein histidine kinase CheA